MLIGLIRVVGFANKIEPRVTRGIGQAAAITRNIGQGARTVRDIGQTVNTATGNRLQNNALYNTAMEVTGKVEQGAATAENVTNNVASEIQNRFN
jgi:prophage DNA circulation protein